jgi:hypothetical protein
VKLDMSCRQWIRFMALLACFPAAHVLAQGAELDFLNHGRPILDAHNCYPYVGKWNDRVQRALNSGFPVSIEQDLAWYVDPATGVGRVVVSHTPKPTGKEPTLHEYFFEQVRPVVEKAIAENHRDHWPIIILHFDFKDNQPALLKAVWQLLGEYQPWLSTAAKTSDPSILSPIERRPILAITEGSDEQQKVFFDDLPVGSKLRLFGSAHNPPAPTNMPTVDPMHWAGAVTLTPEQIVSEHPTNYRRWWNSSWYPVEEGGEEGAGSWTAADEHRLRVLVDHAHALGYWVRFYTLDGFAPGEGQGWGDDYNFGSKEAVILRWKAAIAAGANFISTDQYEDLAQYIEQNSQNLRPSSATAGKR